MTFWASAQKKVGRESPTTALQQLNIEYRRKKSFIIFFSWNDDAIQFQMTLNENGENSPKNQSTVKWADIEKGIPPQQHGM